jgi:trypsin
MADDKQIERMFEELQQRINALEAEVAKLRGGSRRDRSRSAQGGRKAEVLSANRFDRPEVIPPTVQDEPEAIVGGKLTTDFPDCCAVGDDQGFYCTGTLIAPRLVVTAEHCQGITRVFLKGSDIDNLQDGEVRNVVDEKRHPNYDIRVLILDEDSTVQPRHVAQGAEIGNPKKARLVGFGNINLAGTIGYGLKRRVDVPIESLACATAADVSEFGCEQGKEIVAGHRGLLKDSCHGDSGGPLYIKNSQGGYSLLGATSRGLNNSENACGDGGIYVRVDQFLDWIREETGMEIEGELN